MTPNLYCKTRYPVLLVHGIGCNEQTHGGYWGRIPDTLRLCGATVAFGEQSAWGSTADNAIQLLTRAERLLRETDSEKLHLIAHSKGGLEARYLISRLGFAPHTASLTMLSTPNHGTPVAERLDQEKAQRLLQFSGPYWAQFSTEKPFYKITAELTADALKRFNEQTPDAEGVLYQSYGACLGSFATDPAMRFSDTFFFGGGGHSDGLVLPESARWGNYRGTFSGVSHQWICDAFRKDVPQFNVRKLYVSLLHEFQQQGL